MPCNRVFLVLQAILLQEVLNFSQDVGERMVILCQLLVNLSDGFHFVYDNLLISYDLFPFALRPVFVLTRLILILRLFDRL